MLTLRVMQARPDVVYAPLFGPALHGLVRQLRALGFKGRLFVGDSCVDDDLKALGGLLEGDYATQIWFDGPGYAEKYRARFGAQSYYRMSIAAAGYDAMHLLAQAFQALRERAQELNSQNLGEQLARTSFSGITGTVVLSPESRVL